MKVVTAKEMRELDRRASVEYGISSLILMENAGAGAVREIERSFPRLRRSRVAVVCGKGNNGGDGLVVARPSAAIVPACAAAFRVSVAASTPSRSKRTALEG